MWRHFAEPSHLRFRCISEAFDNRERGSNLLASGVFGSKAVPEEPDVGHLKRFEGLE